MFLHPFGRIIQENPGWNELIGLKVELVEREMLKPTIGRSSPQNNLNLINRQGNIIPWPED